jgi:hypothetical protein
MAVRTCREIMQFRNVGEEIIGGTGTGDQKATICLETSSNLGNGELLQQTNLSDSK